MKKRAKKRFDGNGTPSISEAQDTQSLEAFIQHCHARAKYIRDSGFTDLAQKTLWMANKAKEFAAQHKTPH